MKIVTSKKEYDVKKQMAEINVLAVSLYLWVEELNKDGLLKDDPFLSKVINYDAKALKEKVNHLFWNEL